MGTRISDRISRRVDAMNQAAEMLEKLPQLEERTIENLMMITRFILGEETE